MNVKEALEKQEIHEDRYFKMLKPEISTYILVKNCNTDTTKLSDY